MANKFPTRPYIRKMGTIECNNIVETTPLIWKDELYRFEVVRRKSFTASNAQIHWGDLDDSPCLRFVHVRTNTATPCFAEDHTFGFPYVVGDTMHVVTGAGRNWGTDTLVFLRSKDLIHWEYSPLNPVLMYNDFEDKQIASAFLTPADRKRIEEALDTNNSDMEICEYLGRTLIYYSWGDQRGTEFLAEAWYEGSMKDFLQSWFEPKD